MAAGLLLSACVKENRSGSAEGTPVLFSASTVETKTTYTDDVTDGYERIDWSENDQIKINCLQTTPTSATYKIGSGTASGKQSQATDITCTSGNQLQWGSDTHRFFAVYPSSADLSVSGTGNSTEGTMSGTIPASQDGSPALSSYGYMFASATESNPGRYQSVDLAFRPLFNAIRFSLKAADSEMAKQLSSIVLSSSNSLAGPFSATWSAGAATPTSVTPTTGLSTSVTISTSATLSTSTALSVTFITLPIEQTNLTLKLNFSDKTSRTLELKNSGGTKYTLDPYQKLVFREISVPKPTPVDQYYSITFRSSSSTIYSGFSFAGFQLTTPTPKETIIENGLDYVTNTPFMSNHPDLESGGVDCCWTISSSCLVPPSAATGGNAAQLTISLSDLARSKTVTSIELELNSSVSGTLTVNGESGSLVSGNTYSYHVTGNISSIVIYTTNAANKIKSIRVNYSV